MKIMGVKAEKSFEEIVERMASLFKPKSRLGEHSGEPLVEIDSSSPPSDTSDTANSKDSPEGSK